MGLIKAAKSTLTGLLGDQWKEYFYCEALPTNVIVTKGSKRTSSRSSNTSGSDNIISSGSVIAVADGQCMIIVEQGKVVEVCAEPGEFTYDSSTEPSIFSGNLSENIKSLLVSAGSRFTFGGDTGKDQRVYYFNTKELTGNKYGTPSPVPFRVVDKNANIDIDISIRCFGEYSYRVTNPVLFYTNVCGNVAKQYTRDQIESQMKSELLTALQPAFAKISDMGIRYSSLPGHATEIADALNEVLSTKWRDLRGIEIVSFGVSSVKASEEDEAMIKDLQKSAAFKDPTMGAAYTVAARADAMKAAASNTAGAMTGFMGMNMAGAAGGADISSLYAMGTQQTQAAPAADGWTCPNCGKTATGKFCPECGTRKPEPKISLSWTCPSCGTAATGKFCPECGAKRPAESSGWTCPSCGAVAQGKFCPECGTKKPAGAPQYKCDKCGWEPEDPANPPKFCPQCGDPFGDEDVVG